MAGTDSLEMKESLEKTVRSMNKAIGKIENTIRELEKGINSAVITIKNALEEMESKRNGTFSRIEQIGIKAATAMKRVAGDMEAAFSRITHNSLILPIDELNILSDTSDGMKDFLDNIENIEIDVNVNVNAGVVFDHFNETMTESSMSEWKQNIKNAFLIQNWEINLALIGKELSAGFQGLADEINGYELGKSLGNELIVAWQTTEDFIENMCRINPDTFLTGWEELGIALAETIYEISENIDFNRAGTTLADGFNGLVETIRSFNNQMADEGIWQMIADNISNGLNNAISGIHAIGAGQELGRFVTDLLGTLLYVAETTPWHELGTKIGHFLVNIPWATIIGQLFEIITNVLGGFFGGLTIEILSRFGEIGTALANGLNAVFGKLKRFTESVPWDSVAVNIYTGLNNMIQGIDWVGIAKILSNFVMKLLGVFQEVAQKTDWEGFARGIGEFLSNINWMGIFEEVFSTITSVLDGLIEGLSQTWSGRMLITITEMIASLKLAELIHSVLVPILTNIFGKTGTIVGLIISCLTAVFPIIANIGNGQEAAQMFNNFAHNLLEKAIEAIKNIDWGKIFDNVVSLLFNIDWIGITGKIAAFAIELSGRILAGLFEAVGGIIPKLPELALTLVMGLANGIISIISALGSAIKAIFDGIVGGIKSLFGINSPSTVMAELGSFIMQGLIIGIFSLIDVFFGVFADIKDVIVSIWTGITEFLQTTWGFISETAAVVWNGMSEFFGGIWNGIKEAVEVVWTGIADFLQTTWNFISETAAIVWNGITEFFGGIWNGIKEAVEVAWTGIADFLQTTWNFISETAAVVWNGISEFFGGIWSGMKEVAEAVWNGISQFLRGVWEGIRSSAETIWNGISGFLEGIWNGIKGTAESVWNAVAGFFRNVWEGVKSAAEESWNFVSSFLGETWNGIKGAAEEIWGGIKAFFSDTWEGLKAKAKDAGDSIGKFFSDAWDGIRTKTKDAWNSVTETIGSFAANTYEKVKEVPEKIYGAVKNTAGKMQDAGKSLIGGVIEGISSTAGKAYDAISGVAGNLVSSFKNKLGIHSPSRAFMQLADYMIQGLVKGTGEEENRILDKMSELAENMVKPFDGSFRLNLMNDGNYSAPVWDLREVLLDRRLGGQGGFFGEPGNEYFSFSSQYMLDGIEEAAYRGFARASAENTREEDLLEKLIEAVKEGKSITIDGREIVTTYDKWKNRIGWGF